MTAAQAVVAIARVIVIEIIAHPDTCGELARAIKDVRHFDLGL